MRSAIFVMLGVLALCPPALAQDEEAEGAKDHPMFSRMPSYFIAAYDEQEFGLHELRVNEAGDERRVEGRYWKIEYHLRENAKKAGPLQIARNYLNAVLSRGGAKIFEEASASHAILTARLPAAGGHVWIDLTAHESGQSYVLTVIQETAMTQDVRITSSLLAERLASTGTVELRGITFETGKAAIRDESRSVLDAIGGLLKNDPQLKLEIQGHTDNIGSAAANLKLSADRAAAVKAYLVTTLGIEEGRLEPRGFGDTMPAATNDTEEGRAQNRRVVLVKKGD